MITATIRTRKKVSGVFNYKQEIKVFKSVDTAKKFLQPIATDMQVCKKAKKEPVISILAVSYDLDSEKKMLLEIKAITSTENESPQ